MPFLSSKLQRMKLGIVFFAMLVVFLKGIKGQDGAQQQPQQPHVYGYSNPPRPPPLPNWGTMGTGHCPFPSREYVGYSNGQCTDRFGHGTVGGYCCGPMTGMNNKGRSRTRDRSNARSSSVESTRGNIGGSARTVRYRSQEPRRER